MTNVGTSDSGVIDHSVSTVAVGASQRAGHWGWKFRPGQHLDSSNAAVPAVLMPCVGKSGYSYFPLGLGMSGFPSDGFTVILLSGIWSRPWSPLSSLPPDVEVPLPLGFEPVVALEDLGFSELAAGSPVAPAPPGAALCATARE